MNRILFEAAERFNLSTSSAEDDIYERVWKWEDDPENQLKKCQSDEAYTVSPFLGIWNGEAFVYTQKSASLGIWDFAKLLWRYGTAPLRANRLTKEVINRFLRLYEDPLFPWVSLTDAVRVVGLDTVTTKTAESLFKQRGMWGEFAREIVQASTRVNYAQHLSAIHSLESLVCLATEGAMAVRGGNWQMFDAMIHEATRDVRLNTSVTAVEYNSDGLYSVASTSPHSSDIEHFDDVIIATPLQFSGIDINSPSARLPDTIPYVQLHVTLFSTPRALSPSAFNLSGSESVPTFVLTTLQPDEDPGDDLEYGAGKAGFFSISVVKKGRNPHSLPPGRPERIYKIFSDKRVDDAFLARILGVEEPSSESCERDENEDPHRFCGLDENDVSWIHRKVWHSYPFELPRVTFEELRLGESLWYTSGIESFISTMETSALAGKNIAKLVVNEWVKSPETEKTEL
ncbi:Prenylcysteine lyase-domain-containing protein [Lineolata rhizophorae]|uniref:Prenylcysteine lyase-domain-containing protein n=1 Tax=Lineolata rhizophorae TaxID=578093 RepID=A0A6A6P782_9PEZI|nr:Prenylcysteine lyase-domain-containing protein [Lineolata rhizophorae]